MTLVTSRIATLWGANGGMAYIEVTWDDPQIDETTGVAADPNATLLVSQVIYQNLTAEVRHAQVGGTMYDIPAGTPRTERNIPTGQRPRIDSSSVMLY